MALALGGCWSAPEKEPSASKTLGAAIQQVEQRCQPGTSNRLSSRKPPAEVVKRSPAAWAVPTIALAHLLGGRNQHDPGPAP